MVEKRLECIKIKNGRFKSILATCNTLFSIYFNRVEEMNTENIFLDVDRWTQYSHPAKELEHLQHKATPDEIKSYFIHKAINASMLKRISHRQVEKMEENIKSHKIKLIFKEKLKKCHTHRKSDAGSALSSAKSSSKTNSWS